MCYRKRGASSSLQELLDKVRNPGKATTVNHTPVKYSTMERASAKKVLDRLLAMNTYNEVSYITIVPKELEEV